MASEFVPIIDLSTRDTAAGRAALAERIGTACETSGFFTIVGHGVPKDLVDRMYETTSNFFTSPEDVKDRSANRGVGVSGLRRLGGPYEAFAAHVTGDLSEEERAALGDYPATWKAANIWPDAEFRAVWDSYIAAMTDLSADIMRLFALALSLPESFFDTKFDRHVSLIIANYYYAGPKPEVLRRERHTDWGSLTVLYVEDELGGLQVLRGTEDGDDWVDVPAIPGSFVVNIGDLMAFWTGGRWASTVHRVVNPPEPDASSRISIPFFYLPNHDASIEPMGGGSTVEGLEQVTVGQWFSHKMKTTYKAA